MEPGDSAAERIDALASLWGGLDITETAAPGPAFVIERFPEPAPARPDAV